MHGMDSPDPIAAAIKLLGLSAVARACNVTHQAVRKWQRAGRMPRTEWTGETAYCAAIQRATNDRVTREMLLASWPAVASDAQQPAPQPRRPRLVASNGITAEV